MSELQTQLSDEIFSKMQNEIFVLLHTIDAETGGPTSSAISWIHAMEASQLRIAIDQRSKLIENLRKSPAVAVTVFSAGSVYEIKGKAVIKADALEAVPFKLACIDIEIQSVRDCMFYGARITAQPEYEKIYDQRAADKLDSQVFEALKEA